MKNYYVESHSGWFVVCCANMRRAKSEGIYEYGRGQVKAVRPATLAEVTHFQNLKGESATEPSLG
jgi:hypothetical protein